MGLELQRLGRRRGHIVHADKPCGAYPACRVAGGVDESPAHFAIARIPFNTDRNVREVDAGLSLFQVEAAYVRYGRGRSQARVTLETDLQTVSVVQGSVCPVVYHSFYPRTG